MTSDKSTVMKAAVRLTREQVAEIVEVYATVLQDDPSLDGITLLADPDAVKVSAWCMHPAASQLIAL
jgi:hypothetical protein